MDRLFDITYLVTHFGYIGILIIVFLESGIFFPLPGDSLIFTAGLLAPTLHFNIALLALLVFLAAFLGGIAGYYIGTKLDFLYTYPFFRKIFKEKYTNDANAFLKKHGLSAMVLSRFIPIVRTFMPIVAGMVKMDYKDFIKYSLLGSLIWSSVFVLGGYFLGKSFPQIGEYLLYVILIIVFLSILPGVIHFLKNRGNK
ncbi:MAG TPA: VTT domain-containing protein [Candidatus Paceibacterota bacterium]|jgi:membrane-associated protein|nr:VTT domain-containing protein [Candidatus Paceibacterota bacterium]